MLCILLLSLLTASIWAENSTVEDSVLVLTADNFDSVVKENEFILVKFYAPWCAHSKRVAPEYTQAAAQLKGEGSSIRLAKVDATAELPLADRFKIIEYPTFHFFQNGIASEYTGARSTLDFVNWLKKKTGPPARELKDKDAANAIKTQADFVVIGFFKDQESEDAKTFLKVAHKFDELLFGITSDADVFADHKKKKDGVVLFRKFDENKVDFYGQVTEEALTTFIQEYQLPLVVEFSQEVLNKVFASSVRKHVVLFAKKEGNAEILKSFGEVAKDFKGEFLFIHIDVTVEDNARVVKVFNLNNDSAPTLRIVTMVDKMKRFIPVSEGADKLSIKKLIQDYFDDKLIRHLISEEIPAGWDAKPVKYLVGKTFKQVVFNKDNAVFVIFVSPWCAECEHLITTLQDVAKASADDVVIAQIDPTANELEETEIAAFPSFKYFPKGSDKKAIEYDGKVTFEAFELFLETEGKEIIPKDEVEQTDEETAEAEEGKSKSEEEKVEDTDKEVKKDKEEDKIETEVKKDTEEKKETEVKKDTEVKKETEVKKDTEGEKETEVKKDTEGEKETEVKKDKEEDKKEAASKKKDKKAVKEKEEL